MEKDDTFKCQCPPNIGGKLCEEGTLYSHYVYSYEVHIYLFHTIHVVLEVLVIKIES